MNLTRSRRPVCLSFFLLAPLPALALAQDPPEIRWEPYETQGHDGTSLTGKLGRIDVPESRAKREAGKSDATLELAFVVFETDNPDPGPPVFYLIGGPGGPGVEYTPLVATHRMFRLLDHCDVIGIDQRGTGHCVPNLSDGPDFAWELPLDRAITRADVARAQRGAMEACHEHWSSKGVDLAAYNTAESADDLEDVRRALGIEGVTLWGTSYGSHLGLAYLRRHPEGAARAVLMKVEGPDHTYKLPSSVHAQLEQLAERFAAGPQGERIPDLVGLVEELLADLAAEPRTVTVERDGESLEVVCGAYDLQRAIAEQLAETRGHVFLPAFLHAVASGDDRELAERALQYRRGDMWSAMAMMMDCSSGMSAARAKRYEAEREDPAYPLSDALMAPLYPEVCAGCGDPDLGDAFRGPLQCDVPVLFVSGSLDARTPPSNVDEIRGGFPNAVHVLVENTGHDGRELLSPEFKELLAAFLHGDEVEDTRVSLRWDRYAPLR